MAWGRPVTSARALGYASHLLDPENLARVRDERRKRAAERLRKSFRAFVRGAWPHADPAPLVWGWHLEALCDHLQWTTEGKIRRLLINIPPGHAKSVIVSVLWPAWVWARDPKWSAIFASYELGLVTRDAVRSRDLLDSDWYVDLFRNPSDDRAWEWNDDQNAKKLYKNTQGGGRQAVSVGSGTGYRAETLVVDDPLSADQANSDTERENANRWFFETMSTRFNDPETATKIVIMQRLHEADLSGEITRREGAKWCHLSLPSIFEGKASVSRSISGEVLWTDPRVLDGQLLFPQKFSRSVLDDLKTSLGSRAFETQHQQRPSPAAGNVIKRDWFRHRWARPDELPAALGIEARTLPPKFDRILIVTDAAFKAKEDSDRVAIGVFGLKRPDLYLIDLIWDRLTFTETLNALRGLKKKWPSVGRIAIEDKANGSAIIDTLKKELSGIVGFEPQGGKVSRVSACAPFLEAGNVWIPISASWASDLIEEAVSFPKGAHDDGIDMLASAVLQTLLGDSMGALAALAQR